MPEFLRELEAEAAGVASPATTTTAAASGSATATVLPSQLAAMQSDLAALMAEDEMELPEAMRLAMEQNLGIHVAAEPPAHCKPATDAEGWLDVDPAPSVFFSTDYPPSGPAGDLQCTTRLESDTRQEVLRNLTYGLQLLQPTEEEAEQAILELQAAGAETGRMELDAGSTAAQTEVDDDYDD